MKMINRRLSINNENDALNSTASAESSSSSLRGHLRLRSYSNSKPVIVGRLNSNVIGDKSLLYSQSSSMQHPPLSQALQLQQQNHQVAAPHSSTATTARSPHRDPQHRHSIRDLLQLAESPSKTKLKEEQRKLHREQTSEFISQYKQYIHTNHAYVSLSPRKHLLNQLQQNQVQQRLDENNSATTAAAAVAGTGTKITIAPLNFLDNIITYQPSYWAKLTSNSARKQQQQQHSSTHSMQSSHATSPYEFQAPKFSQGGQNNNAPTLLQGVLPTPEIQQIKQKSKLDHFNQSDSILSNNNNMILNVNNSNSSNSSQTTQEPINPLNEDSSYCVESQEKMNIIPIVKSSPLIEKSQSFIPQSMPQTPLKAQATTQVAVGSKQQQEQSWKVLNRKLLTLQNSPKSQSETSSSFYENKTNRIILEGMDTSSLHSNNNYNIQVNNNSTIYNNPDEKFMASRINHLDINREVSIPQSQPSNQVPRGCAGETLQEKWMTKLIGQLNSQQQQQQQSNQQQQLQQQQQQQYLTQQGYAVSRVKSSKTKMKLNQHYQSATASQVPSQLKSKSNSNPNAWSLQERSKSNFKINNPLFTFHTGDLRAQLSMNRSFYRPVICSTTPNAYDLSSDDQLIKLNIHPSFVAPAPQKPLPAFAVAEKGSTIQSESFQRRKNTPLSATSNQNKTNSNFYQRFRSTHTPNH